MGTALAAAHLGGEHVGGETTGDELSEDVVDGGDGGEPDAEDAKWRLRRLGCRFYHRRGCSSPPNTGSRDHLHVADGFLQRVHAALLQQLTHNLVRHLITPVVHHRRRCRPRDDHLLPPAVRTSYPVASPRTPRWRAGTSAGGEAREGDGLLADLVAVEPRHELLNRRRLCRARPPTGRLAVHRHHQSQERFDRKSRVGMMSRANFGFSSSWGTPTWAPCHSVPSCGIVRHGTNVSLSPRIEALPRPTPPTACSVSVDPPSAACRQRPRDAVQEVRSMRSSVVPSCDSSNGCKHAASRPTGWSPGRSPQTRVPRRAPSPVYTHLDRVQHRVDVLVEQGFQHRRLRFLSRVQPRVHQRRGQLSSVSTRR